MKLIRCAIFFLPLLVLSLVQPLFADGPSPNPAAPALLADIHRSKQIGCASCHGTAKAIKVDDSENGVSRRCIECHGGLAELGSRSHSRSEEAINAHQSHLGDVNCSVCHHGHEVSQAYCLGCHSFEMKIPAGAAATATPAAVPGSRTAASHIRAERTDIVVVGSGAAGLTAAITAHDAGARVIILEKQPISGGNSLLAEGGMNAAGTRFQKAKGIEDSAEQMFKDTMAGGRNVNDPALVKILADNSAASLEWLVSLGADLTDVGRGGGASVARAHRPVSGGAVGPVITGALKRAAAERKIDIRLNSKVVKLLQAEHGRVYGVEVEGKHQSRYVVRAAIVILAAGGFSANGDKVAFYRPELKGMTTSNQPGATGDGADLGAGAGARLRDMTQIQIHPTGAKGSRILVSEAVRGDGAILVNRAGKRFVNEMSTRDRVSAAILQQEGKSAFLVFDEGVRKNRKLIEGYFHLKLITEANTVGELAAKMKLPLDALASTLATYNATVDAKNDAEFQRSEMARRLETPKFYSVEVAPVVHYTMGGVAINTESRALSEKGEPIPGLFAVGEVSGGVHGANRLGGNSLSQTITFGRIAGAKAAEAIRQSSAAKTSRN